MEGKLETPFQIENRKVWIAGHRGLVGGAIAKRLSRENCSIVTIDRNELDLRDQIGVKKWLEKEKPSIIIIAAAKVGGIFANSTQPADFLYDRLSDPKQLKRVREFILEADSSITPELAFSSI